MNVESMNNISRVGLITDRHRRGITLTYRLSTGEVVTRSGIVRKVDVQSSHEDNWTVEISQPPLPGLSSNVSARIGIDQLIEITPGTQH